MKRVLTCFFLAFSCIFVSCASTPRTPSAIPMGDHDLTFVKSRNPISLINKQEIKIAEVEVKGGGMSVVDLNSCCNQAIALLGQWLNYNKIPIEKNAGKKLSVSVLNPKISEGGSHSFDLKIETGDGLVKIFDTECTAFGSGRALGYALNWGVVKVIHDADILYYMEK